MSLETQPIGYNERVATVVGGRGQLGSRIVNGLEGLGLKEVKVCEKGDPFADFVRSSSDIFFAVNAEEAKDMLQSTRDLLKPHHHSILDGASVKSPLISTYRELDDHGISVCSTHLGANPTQPWRGIKVWVCEVGQNSGKAKRLAIDLFIAKNTSIQEMSIVDHGKVEEDQFFTHAIMQIFAGALREHGLPMEEFSSFATLNSDLAVLPLGRSLGQGTAITSEILSSQPRRIEFFTHISDALKELGENLDDREKLQAFIRKNIDFHNDPFGAVDSAFKKAGVVGSHIANLRMHTLRLRIRDDQPGKLREILKPFYDEGANLTAIDSMPGVITPEEAQLGVDPDNIVDFDIGIDPNTIDPQKEQRIKDTLREMGFLVNHK